MANYQTSKMINELVEEIHQGNVKAGWWTDIKTGEPLNNAPRIIP